MDVFEAEFHCVVVTGAEGWSAQHGEASLSSRVGQDDGDEADSVDIPAAETQVTDTQTQPQAQIETQLQAQKQTQAGAKRKRKEKDVPVDACLKQTEALEVKNKITEWMLECEHAYSVENVLEILNELPGVRECFPLYEVAIELLIDSEGSRRGFITFKLDEAKIRFLEPRNKIKRDH